MNDSWCFTFGPNSEYADRYVCVEGSYEQARLAMRAVHGLKYYAQAANDEAFMAFSVAEGLTELPLAEGE